MNHILVVDDDRDNALVIRMVLEHQGYKVDMFTDSDALANFEPQRYALALIDLRMGGLDGFGLYERILKMDNIKICFMSGYDYRDALSKFQTKHRIPAERYLQKPLNVDRLIGLVRKMTAASSGQEGYATQYSSQDGNPGEQFV